MTFESRIKSFIDLLGPDIKAIQTTLAGRLGLYGQQVTDWSAVTSAGFYWGSNTAINGPVAGSWFMGRAEAAFNSNNITLTVWDYVTGTSGDTKTYQNARVGGVWSGWRRLRLTQDELDTRYGGAGGDPYSWETLASQINNSSNVTDVNVFTGFLPAASTRYHVECLFMALSAAATTAVRLQLSGHTLGVNAAAIQIRAAASALADHVNNLSALNTVGANTAGMTTANLIKMEAILDFGAGVNAVNVRPQVRSEILASQVSILPGSYMKWRVVP
jgi:hypothetical protein